jgi:hypothetical protein
MNEKAENSGEKKHPLKLCILTCTSRRESGQRTKGSSEDIGGDNREKLQLLSEKQETVQ